MGRLYPTHILPMGTRLSSFSQIMTSRFASALFDVVYANNLKYVLSDMFIDEFGEVTTLNEFIRFLTEHRCGYDIMNITFDMFNLSGYSLVFDSGHILKQIIQYSNGVKQGLVCEFEPSGFISDSDVLSSELSLELTHIHYVDNGVTKLILLPNIVNRFVIDNVDSYNIHGLVHHAINKAKDIISEVAQGKSNEWRIGPKINGNHIALVV